MTDPDEQLRSLLRAEPPESVQALDAATRADLTTLIADARRDQARNLSEAFDAAVKYVPFPVRGIVRRVLGG